jgi:hypothetical protein
MKSATPNSKSPEPAVGVVSPLSRAAVAQLAQLTSLGGIS